MKVNKKIIFIILCYREKRDLINLINNLNQYRDKIHILIVNSYYDEKSKMDFENIAKENKYDFINIENRGYGYGNNRGIEYANKNYKYEFLCICNSDIEFEKLPLDVLDEKYYSSLIAPQIKTKNGKSQNPYYYFNLKIVDMFKYFGLVKGIRVMFYIGVIINKIVRIFMDNFLKLIKKNDIKVYACHGACFFIGHRAVKKITPLYNEKMFLFHEEEHLAKKLKICNIPIYLNTNIKLIHFEDGSSESIKDSTFKYMIQSYTEHTKYWKNIKFKE